MKSARKLAFHIKSLMKEEEIIGMGITKFIYREDIENYIDASFSLSINEPNKIGSTKLGW